MKIYTQYIILFVCFSFVAKVGVSQNEQRTPYPIIFVHGLVGDETTWSDNTYDIIDFLKAGTTPLRKEQVLNITLDKLRSTTTLCNTIKEDVELFTKHPIPGDLYIINFNVHANNTIPNGCIGNVLLSTPIFATDDKIAVVDAGIFQVGDIISIQNEFMQVTAVNGFVLTVQRDILGSKATFHLLPNIIYNLSNESNQAAIAKQGYGLKLAIDAVKNANPGVKKVILVGHSMGGLAIREYIRSYYQHDVAKVVTIGTPHYGSNLSDIPVQYLAGIDGKSDAVRDLRTSISYKSEDVPGLVGSQWLSHLGIFLYGGPESMLSEYNCKDVNCNGLENDLIKGINDFSLSPFPEDISKTWIASDRFGNNDGIVLTKSQYIYFGDTIMTHDPHNSSFINILNPNDISEPKDIYALIRGLDEPDDPELAYEISDSSTNKGFITFGTNYNPVDNDFYKINLLEEGKLKITIQASSYTGIKQVNLIDENNVTVKSFTDISDFIEYQAKPGIYFIQIKGLATIDGPDVPGSYLYPYTLKTEFTRSPPISLKVSPSSLLEFYDVVINAPKTKTVTLTNNGTKDILITGISLSGADASQFTVTPLPPFTVKPGQSSDITVKFNPTTTGAKMAAIEITTNAPDIPTKTISLKGNATDHETKFLVCSVTNSYNYGNVRTSTNKTKTFIIQNTGSNDCEISDLSIEGLNPDAYAITAPVVKTFTLSSGESTKITVQFSPASVGVKNAYLSVLNNSDNVSPKDSIELYGNGIENFYTGANTNIVAYEYWFDDNYTSRVYTSITPQQYFSLNTTFSTNELTAGLHRLQIRYRDSKGKWSAVISEVFHKMPIAPSGTRKITQYEYWFDNEYSSRVTTSVEPQQVYILNSGIDAIALPVGLHTFHTRFKDDASQWSSVVTEVFYKLRVSLTLPNLIVGYRYWFDLDNSTLKSVSLPVPVNPYHLVKDISTCGLTGGDHTIHFQFKDTNQAWSSVVTDTFNIELLAIPVITAKGATTFCEGGSVTLSSSSAGSYLWNNSATTQDISVTNSGSYFVSAGNGCNGSLASEAITITVNPFPLFPETPAGPDTVDLQITFNTQYTIPGVSYADSYIWNLVPESAGEISGSDVTGTVNWNPNYLGFASIKAMSVNSCGQSALSVEKQTYVDNTTSIANNELASLKIFPNPNNGSFYINSSKPLNRVIIRDVLGKIFDQTNYPSNNQLFEYRLNEGVYLVHIFMNDKEFIRKIIVKKER